MTAISSHMAAAQGENAARHSSQKVWDLTVRLRSWAVSGHRLKAKRLAEALHFNFFVPLRGSAPCNPCWVFLRCRRATVCHHHAEFPRRLGLRAPILMHLALDR